MTKGVCQPLSCKCGKAIIPQYYVVTLLGFFTKICFYSTRVCINILATGYVSRKNITEDPLKTYCPLQNLNATTSETEHDYTDLERGLIQASFYVGYIISHLPSGMLSDYFGGRTILLLSLIFSSICTILLPFMVTKSSFGWITGSRIVIGISHGFAYPALGAIITRWIPIQRRGILGTFIMTGTIFGMLIGGNVTRYLIAKTGAWETPFFFFGSFGLIFCTALIVWMWNTPAEHPYIKPAEVKMLSKMLVSRQKRTIPFLNIVKDRVIWANVAGYFAHSWITLCYRIFLTEYITRVLNYKISETWLLAGLVFAGLCLSAIATGILSDFLYNRKKVQISTLRVWFTIFGNVIPSFFFLLSAITGCNPSVAITLFAFSIVTKGPAYASLKINFLDITYHFGGTVEAIFNGLGALSGIMVPYFVQQVCKDDSIESWRKYFSMTMVITLLCSAIYYVFTESERRNWDLIEAKRVEESGDNVNDFVQELLIKEEK